MKIVSVVPTSRRPLCGSERRFRFFDQSASNGSVVSMFAWRLAGRRGSALGAHRTQPCAARPCGGQLPPDVRWNRRSERGGRCAFRVARQPAGHWNKARHGQAHAVVARTIYRPGRSGREALNRTRQQQPDGVVQMDVGVPKAGLRGKHSLDSISPLKDESGPRRSRFSSSHYGDSLRVFCCFCCFLIGGAGLKQVSLG